MLIAYYAGDEDVTQVRGARVRGDAAEASTVGSFTTDVIARSISLSTRQAPTP